MADNVPRTLPIGVRRAAAKNTGRIVCLPSVAGPAQTARKAVNARAMTNSRMSCAQATETVGASLAGRTPWTRLRQPSATEARRTSATGLDPRLAPRPPLANRKRSCPVPLLWP